jgi:hypothetical protein
VRSTTSETAAERRDAESDADTAPTDERHADDATESRGDEAALGPTDAATTSPPPTQEPVGCNADPTRRPRRPSCRTRRSPPPRRPSVTTPEIAAAATTAVPTTNARRATTPAPTADAEPSGGPVRGDAIERPSRERRGDGGSDVLRGRCRR